MRAYIGTSGWWYDWNKESSLDWYIENSGLNAIELNASFYRFPFPNQVKGWHNRGSTLTWVVKVHRLITHTYMLHGEAHHVYERFLELFKPLDESIALYLFQMPPRFKPSSLDNIEKFIKNLDSSKIAFEFRNEEWYNFDFDKLDFDGVIVTPDSPEIQDKPFYKNNCIYMRFHGRSSWYSYKYSENELKAVAKTVKIKNPKRAFAFFNNDHNMLSNARTFMKLLKNQ